MRSHVGYRPHPKDEGRYCFHRCVSINGGGGTPLYGPFPGLWSHVISREREYPSAVIGPALRGGGSQPGTGDIPPARKGGTPSQDRDGGSCWNTEFTQYFPHCCLEFYVEGEEWFITSGRGQSRNVLVSENFYCFATIRCQHLHCNAMRTTNQAHMSWQKLNQNEYTPGFPGVPKLQ